MQNDNTQSKRFSVPAPWFSWHISSRKVIWCHDGRRSAGWFSWWEAVIEHPARTNRQRRCSTSSWQRSHGCQPFSLPDVCWKYNTEERKQPRRFLECLEDNLLTQLVRAYWRRCPGRPAVCEQRTGGWCGGWWQSWADGSRNVRVFNSGWSKEGHQKFCLGLLVGKPWPV